MKLTYILITISIFFTSCAPVIKHHGYQLEDIMLTNPKVVGTTSKSDIYASYGSPSLKIEDVGNTWLYITTVKEKKVFSRDEFKEQIIFAFSFDDSDVLVSQEIYDKNKMLDIEYNKKETYNYGSNYSILDQLYDAFTRGL